LFFFSFNCALYRKKSLMARLNSGETFCCWNKGRRIGERIGERLGAGRGERLWIGDRFGRRYLAPVRWI
jgi:hypothetical protein